jgi:hypothetical protein
MSAVLDFDSGCLTCFSLARANQAMTKWPGTPLGYSLCTGRKLMCLGTLGRALISTKPNSDGCQLDKCEVVVGELVVSGRDPSALLDLVEESLDQITCAVQIGTEADRLAAIAFRRNICPCALLTDEGPDPVGVISSICQQHRSRPHSFE